MRLFTTIAKRLTAALSIALILVGVVVSGHAMAAHMTGLSNAAAAPCHHAMDDGAAGLQGDSFGALDLCRQLCLNKIPDAAITAAAVQTEAAVQISPAAPQAVHMVATHRAPNLLVAPAPPDQPRAIAYLTSQRLLI
jgi:hypothetical protein